ncbi:hypothetical protein QQS21_004679 [Conoideocrella luteorostrata]|uniref:Major facilitator superfamily (MFS) profile domain-containing protein n=1 Tax=Conoideocrella luteorostrata TaxID=1105319 RepID=A0AAJ0CQX9_9HYPO|nr:hypothetical protein QQS21_004679 [Conoideocrella luteorostrata]
MSQHDNKTPGQEVNPINEADNSNSVQPLPAENNVLTPTQLSWPRKIHIIIAGFTCTFNCNLGSSVPSGAISAISEHFSVTDQSHLVLLNSLYMLGYVIGPLLFGPLSEYLGRRPVLIGTFLGYLAFMAACAVAPNHAALLVFRLLCGISASAPTSVIGGLYADILDKPSQRGTAMALYMTVTTVGPLIGPVLSGFSSQISWRWPFILAALIAIAGLPLVLTLPETYAPILHNRTMRKIKQQDAEGGADCRRTIHVLEARKIFVRPAVLMATEPVLLFTALYIALAYAIMYLTFQAYPIIFQGQ